MQIIIGVQLICFMHYGWVIAMYLMKGSHCDGDHSAEPHPSPFLSLLIGVSGREDDHLLPQLPSDWTTALPYGTVPLSIVCLRQARECVCVPFLCVCGLICPCIFVCPPRREQSIVWSFPVGVPYRTHPHPAGRSSVRCARTRPYRRVSAGSDS